MSDISTAMQAIATPVKVMRATIIFCRANMRLFK